MGVFVVIGVVVLISEAFENYRSVVVYKNQSPKTEEHLLVTCRALIVFFGDIPIQNLTFELIRLWKIELSKRRTPSTVRGYIIKLRVVLRHCKSQGLLVVDPEDIPVPQRVDKLPECATPEEVNALIASTNVVRNKLIFSLLYASGIRVSELCALNKIDTKDGRFSVVGKGGKARLCFIDDRTSVYLKQYLRKRKDDCQALLTGKYDCRRITPGNVQEMFRIARNNAGLERPIHPHSLRHSFATNLMSNGMHIYKVQRLMGHNSIQTTQQYLHVTDPDLQSDYKKYHTT